MDGTWPYASKVPTKSRGKIRMAQWNANGVLIKKLALTNFLYEEQVDIILIQKTHLKEGQRFWIRGYETFQNDRADKRNGRIATLVKNNLAAAELAKLSGKMECLKIEIVTAKFNVLVANVYSPPNEEFDLGEITPRKENWLLLGDLNGDSPSWGYPDMDKKGEDIEDWMIDNQLVLVN